MKNFFKTLFNDNNSINEKSIIGFLAFVMMIAFAIADIPLIKAALHTHIKTLDETDPDVTRIASLLHRLGRVG